MKLTKLLIFLTALTILSACDTKTNQNATANAINTANSNTKPVVQNLSEVPRPQKISDMMNARGEQDKAAPTIKVLEPKDGATVNSSTIKIKLELGGDLKGYKPMKDMATGTGNHIHLILDNLPYEPFYNADQEFEFRNVADGEHTLRVFPSRPWHESYKNAGAFQMIKFTVRNGGADNSKPALTNSNQTMTNTNAATAPEGKDMPPSTAGAVDPKKPLLTYSRPKGEYKLSDSDTIMIDFWLSGNNPVLKYDDPNGSLVAVGSPFRVRYSIDGGEAKFIDKWEPIWLTGWTEGKHTVKLELIDKDGNLVDNGGYNSTTREITVAK